MTIHDVEVGNTTKLDCIYSFVMYFQMDTTSLAVTAEFSPNVDRVVSFTNGMSITSDLSFVYVTPIPMSVSSDIAIDSGISFGKDIAIIFASSITIGSFIDQEHEAGYRLCRYSPKILGETNMPTTVDLATISDVTLYGGTCKLQLPKPVFGNTDNLNMTVLQRSTNDGYTVIDPLTDTNVVSKTYIFEDINLEKKQEYVTFINQTAGLIITMSDFEGATKDIIIVNLDEAITETNLGFDIQMDFEEV